MKKWVFLSGREQVISCLIEDGRMKECRIDDREGSFVGSIYTAQIENLVPSIQAAFLKIGDRRCYFSIKGNPMPVFTRQARPGTYTVGDEILVQIETDALKTKEPAVRSTLQISGRFGVVMYPETGVYVSKKIRDEALAGELKAKLKHRYREQTGVLIRTNAKDADRDEVFAELDRMEETLRTITETAQFRSAGSLLWKPEPAYLKTVQSLTAEIDELVTDNEELYQELSGCLKQYPATASIPCRLYSDPLLSLDACLRIRSQLEKALEKQVWMSSGAYLVIEQTEALTAIDVNTGKAGGKKKDMEEFVFQVNREAAKEIMAQIRLRNLSGILILDFINMKSREHQEALMAQLRQLAAQDPVPVAVVDLTALGLVELTRKKERDTLERQYRARNFADSACEASAKSVTV